MKVCILYRPRSEHARRVEEFVHEFERQKGIVVETLSLDTRNGAAMASLYDIMKYPAVMILRDDGQLHKLWTDDQLPLMNEVAISLST